MLNLFLYSIFLCVHSLILYIASKNILILEPVGNIFNIFHNLFKYYSFKFQCTKAYINVLIGWWLDLLGVFNNLGGMTVNINASNSSSASIVGGVIAVTVTIGYIMYRFFKAKNAEVTSSVESDKKNYLAEEAAQREIEKVQNLEYSPLPYTYYYTTYENVVIYIAKNPYIIILSTCAAISLIIYNRKIITKFVKKCWKSFLQYWTTKTWLEYSIKVLIFFTVCLKLVSPVIIWLAMLLVFGKF